MATRSEIKDAEEAVSDCYPKATAKERPWLIARWIEDAREVDREQTAAEFTAGTA